MTQPREPGPGYRPGNGHNPAAFQPVSDTPERDSGSITGLLRQLTHEVTSLFTKEVALAKAEASESLHNAKAGVAAVATGGAVLMAGLIILLLAAVYGLSTVVAPWLAALIVGGVVVVIGLVMVQAGKKKLEARAMRPDRTIHTMQKDKDALKGRQV